MVKDSVDTLIISSVDVMVAAVLGQGALHLYGYAHAEGLPVARVLALRSHIIERRRIVQSHRRVAQIPIVDQPDGASRDQLIIGGTAAKSLLLLGGAVGADDESFI